MKTYLFKIKYWITLSSVAFLATASTTWAQDGPTGAAQPAQQQSSEVQVNQPAQDPTLQPSDEAQMSRDQMQRDMATTGSLVDEPAGAGTETNWSWLGLLGLLGLFGLKRRHEAHDENYRSVRGV